MYNLAGGKVVRLFRGEIGLSTELKTPTARTDSTIRGFVTLAGRVFHPGSLGRSRFCAIATASTNIASGWSATVAK